MTTFVRKPSTTEETLYQLFYERILQPGSGFAFDCDAAGNVITRGLGPTALESLRHCKADTLREFRAPYVTSHVHRLRDHGSIRCGCGAEHDLEDSDSACNSCGQLFNAFGQALAAPELWED